MALAKEFYLGSTHIRIFDDYCVKTQAEVDAILNKCGEIAANSIIAKMMREEDKNANKKEPQK